MDPAEGWRWPRFRELKQRQVSSEDEDIDTKNEGNEWGAALTYLNYPMDTDIDRQGHNPGLVNNWNPSPMTYIEIWVSVPIERELIDALPTTYVLVK